MSTFQRFCKVKIQGAYGCILGSRDPFRSFFYLITVVVIISVHCACVAAKGDDTSECAKFAKYYRSLCPGEWVSNLLDSLYAYKNIASISIYLRSVWMHPRCVAAKGDDTSECAKFAKYYRLAKALQLLFIPTHKQQNKIQKFYQREKHVP
ncbi:cytochrome c oxidase subunit 6B-3 [Tanacetum coccineum]